MQDKIFSAGFSPNGKNFATGDLYDVCIFDSKLFSLIHKIENAHENYIYEI